MQVCYARVVAFSSRRFHASLGWPALLLAHAVHRSRARNARGRATRALGSREAFSTVRFPLQRARCSTHVRARLQAQATSARLRCEAGNCTRCFRCGVVHVTARRRLRQVTGLTIRSSGRLRVGRATIMRLRQPPLSSGVRRQ